MRLSSCKDAIRSVRSVFMAFFELGLGLHVRSSSCEVVFL